MTMPYAFLSPFSLRCFRSLGYRFRFDLKPHHLSSPNHSSRFPSLRSTPLALQPFSSFFRYPNRTVVRHLNFLELTQGLFAFDLPGYKALATFVTSLNTGNAPPALATDDSESPVPSLTLPIPPFVAPPHRTPEANRSSPITATYKNEVSKIKFTTMFDQQKG